MSALDLAALRAAAVSRTPFEYLVVPRFVKPEAAAAINADFPKIGQPGSFPLSELSYGSAFAGLISELQSEEFRRLFEEKFALDLSRRATMITVRGRCSERDGSIHTDTASKIITVLIYMNSAWEAPGGRLRLLRSATDLDDVILEVPPVEGTLLAFRRSDHSFHGHRPFIGERRVIQFNWVVGQGVVRREMMRHRFSAMVKRLLGRKPKPAA
jgi:hypothetical protein